MYKKTHLVRMIELGHVHEVTVTFDLMSSGHVQLAMVWSPELPQSKTSFPRVTI